MKNRYAKTLLAALFASVAFLAPADPKPYAVIEIDSVDAVTRDLSALGMILRNPALMGGPAQAGFLLGSPGFVGIDKGKPLRLVFPSERDLVGNRPVVVVPLSDADGSAYLASFGAIAEKTGDDNGLISFKGRQFPMDFRLRIAGGSVLFATAGSIGERALSDMASSLTADPNAFAVRGISGTIRADLSVAAVQPALENLLRDQLESIEDDDERASARAAVDEAKNLLRGVSRLALGLEFDAEQGLSIWYRVDAVPDSDLDKTLHRCHLPSPRVLSRIETTDIGFQTSGCDEAIGRLLAPLVATLAKAAPDGAAPGLTPDNSPFNLFTSLVTQDEEAHNASTATTLVRDADGRPVLRFFVDGDESWIAEAGADLVSPDKTTPPFGGIAFGEVSTREEQGATIHFLPILAAPAADEDDEEENPAAKAFANYIVGQGYGYEWVVKDGLLLGSFGPQGSVLPLLAAPAAPATDPMAKLFADVDNRAQAASFSLGDAATILDIFLSIPDVVPVGDEEFTGKLRAAIEKDRNVTGTLLLVSGNSAVGVLRASPALLRSLSAVGDIFGERRNMPPPPPPANAPLTNEDIDALLQEAED